MKTTKIAREAVLVLEDGSFVKGSGFGAIKKISGEVVFNTGMVGYTEAITDPSYKGQILMQTYPLIGNYGVYEEHFESESPQIEGYIIRELCDTPSHWSSQLTLGQWFEKSGVPGIQYVDTRMLTKKIRNQGTMLGILQVFKKGENPDLKDLIEEAKEIPDPNERNLVAEVASKKVKKIDANGDLGVVLIDCGVKKSIIKNLVTRGLNVTLVPPKMTASEIFALEPDGVIISSGPGNPKMCENVIENVVQIAETNLPIFGICLGMQIITLSMGGDTYKLRFGHRGQNHPCIDLSTERCYITSQNHGYAVDANSLEKTGLYATFINANDKTIEGVAHKKKKIFGIQFHPEASPGPNDSNYMFDHFLEILGKYAEQGK
ncbi:glutamine-hydrolyzing carbamoyl-phosphate synthase small subunit [Candidatus Bathyarchaeota archaeon]|nr:glutamine-hydrolyzing carbamoyl-phosphate synthase small subunit [Candidatus Bathyarchaeota archaeon]